MNETGCLDAKLLHTFESHANDDDKTETENTKINAVTEEKNCTETAAKAKSERKK